MISINLDATFHLAKAFDCFGEEGFGKSTFKIGKDTFAQFAREGFLPAKGEFINVMTIKCPNNVILTIKYNSHIDKNNFFKLLTIEIERLGAIYKAQYSTVATMSILIN